jgi:ZIP family zinc transporter
MIAAPTRSASESELIRCKSQNLISFAAMLTAIVIGLISGGAVLLGALLGLRLRIDHRVIAVIMAFGAGVLISALSIDLMDDGFEKSKEPLAMGIAFLAGAVVFVVGDWFIDTRGGRFRKSPNGMAENLESDNPEASSGNAIFLGTLLDGIPESFVVGASVATGGVGGFVFIIAVFLSNLPEGISGTMSMKMSGMPTRRIVLLWVASLVVTVASTVAGYLFLDTAPAVVSASIKAFASGAILAMLCDTMIPEAFRYGGRFVALVSVAGFLLAFMLTEVF